MSDKSIKPPDISDKSLASSLDYFELRARGKIDAQCLKQDKVTFIHKKIVSIYIVYEINVLQSFRLGDDFSLRNALSGAVKPVKDAEKGKCKYSGHGMEFYSHETFSLSNGSGFGRNIIIFGAHINSSVHVDNKKKNYLILIKGSTDGLDYTMLTAKKEYLINFKEHNKKFCLSACIVTQKIMSRKHFE